MLLAVVLALLLVAGQAATNSLLPCENALPPGEGFGGTVTITSDCLWRPQLHFISSLTGEQRDYPGPLEAPIIYYEPALVAPSQSGPGRLTLNNVVLANFTLSSPGSGSPVLWPKGMLQPGLQPGSTVPRKLYMYDVKIITTAQSIREYVSFFANRSQEVYTDNVTFVHVPYWADDRTTAVSVGLLLGTAGGSQVQDLAGSKPLPGHNFVVAADQSTLQAVLQSGAAARTTAPFLVYLSSNVSLSTSKLKVRALAINRPLYLVGKTTDYTSIDFGMEVNTLVLGPLGSVTCNKLVLENLAPGDTASAALAGPYEVLMSYHMWAVAFNRAEAESPRLVVENCTLVVSSMALEQYLFKATLFRVKPAGFTQQLQRLSQYIDVWSVSWMEPTNSVYVEEFESIAVTFNSVNITSQPAIAVALPVPDRRTMAVTMSQHALSEYQLTHVGQAGMDTLQLGPVGGADPNQVGARELVMLTTNVTLGSDGPAVAAATAATGPQTPAAPDEMLYRQLRKFLAANVGSGALQQHVLMGIVVPPVTLDLAYSKNLVQLPPAMPPGHFALVNMVALHLSQGPGAASPDATVLLPDVWTHLLWSIQRTSKNTVLLSNVTLWVPAAEFSFIRSHTGEQPATFTINLQGDMNMRFYNVRDLRADGLFIQRYLGPGLEAESLTLRVEAGWSQNGQPPRGFWATAALPAEQPDSNPNKLSDAMVVVLAACLVTAVVASVLACLAFVFWRKRAAENRQQRAQRAAATDGELGSVKAGSEPGSQAPASDQYDRTRHGSSREPGEPGGGSGTGVLAGGRRLRGSGILPGLLRDSMPVHDSSDSYNIPEAVDRAALTAELAHSKFGPRNLSAQDGGGSTSSSGGSSGGGRGRDRDRPPAAAAVGASTTSMASDACLQRLQSAITTMSQDVLSRRLQYAMGADGSPVVMGMAAAGTAVGLGRPSPLGLAQGGQQQERQGLTPPLEGSDADGNAYQQQQHSGSVLGRRSSSSLGRASTHHGSPNAAAVAAATALAEQQQREGPGGLEAADAQPWGPRVPGVVPTKAPSQGGGPAAWADAAACGGGAGGVATSSVGSAASRMGSAGGIEQLKLLQLVGQGTFGQVYKAIWRRRCVAVKVLQLPATAGSSDVPWRGMGRATSHREKMAVMETVVSTTMSHPNIVQVYTYVLQPLMQGSMPRSRKQLDGAQATKKQQQQQRQLQQEQPHPEIELQPQPLDVVQPQLQLQPQAVDLLQQPQPLKVQGAAAQLLARFSKMPAQQQEQQPPQPNSQLPPDPGSGSGAAAAAAAATEAAPDAAADGAPPQQQQQPEQGLLHQQPLEQQLSGSLHSSRGRSRCASACDDSSQSLTLIRAPGKDDLTRLTPEMAKAAAAALPAAAAAAAGHDGDGFGPRQLKQQRSSNGSGSSDADDEDGSQGEDVHQGPVLVGWELRLVMEFCDAGSLRTALDHKLLIDRATGLPALECVLFLAHDVACAMIHLHSEHLLHGDLKASNVLLKRTAPRLPLPPEQPAAAGAGGGGRRGSYSSHSSQAGSLIGQGLGLMAKVADFGLSLTLGPTDTHVSQMHMGTLTHMAPELLLHGRASKASDVYAFGILLWELATGRRPYSGTPVGMLAHKVVQQGWRPAWPGGCSQPVQVLVEGCWTQDPAERPSFEQVVQQLEEMASHLDELKQQQAQAMAAAAAPLFHPASGHHDSDPGHELTPSMMAELMPSGFSAGSGPSDIEEEAHCSGVLYEMSQLSGGSGDRAQYLAMASDEDADAAVVEGCGVHRSQSLVSGAALCAGEVAHSTAGLEGANHSSSSMPGRVAAVVQ